MQGGGTRGVASNVEALHYFDDYFRASYQPSLVSGSAVTQARVAVLVCCGCAYMHAVT